MNNKIYIVGPVGSGKTTLAKEISKNFNYNLYELDFIFYRKEYYNGSKKRTPQEINLLLDNIISKDRWLVEDLGREIFAPLLEECHSIILLDPPKYIRYYRMITRWIKQNLKIEDCGYTPSFSMLRKIIKGSMNYDTNADGLKERLVPFKNKISILKNKKDIEIYLKKL